MAGLPGKIMFIVFCIALAGCGAQVKREVHSLDGWRVVYTDEKEMSEQCAYALSGCPKPCFVRGCADIANRTIYCKKFDFEACGHELHHITDTYWHEPR